MSGYTSTPNFALKKPITGTDNGMWGTHWNQNADTLDATLKVHDDSLSGAPFLSASGGTIAGNLTILGNLTVNGNLILPNLPKSTSGLAVGTLWNNGGFLCVV